MGNLKSKRWEVCERRLQKKSRVQERLEQTPTLGFGAGLCHSHSLVHRGIVSLLERVRPTVGMPAEGLVVLKPEE